MFRPQLRHIRQTSLFSSHHTKYPSSTYSSQRNIRIMSLDAETQINMIPNTVAYKFINENGGSKRFYREVFLEKFHDPEISAMINKNIGNNGTEDISTDVDFNSYIIRLDNRLLTINDCPIVIDNYDLALFCASEFEAQGEYIRTESMPISQIVASLIERNLGLQAMPRDIQRQSWGETVKSRLEHDLLLIAENQRLMDIGFYERNWKPIIQWFNATFDLNLKLQYMIMKGEGENVDAMKDAMNEKTMYDMNIDDMLDRYQDCEMAQTVTALTTKFKGYKYEYGLIPKFLANLDDVRLMMISDIIRYCYSPMIAIGLVLNVISIEKALIAIQCPELDVQMIAPIEEELKLNDTVLYLAAVRNFMNCYDQILPVVDGIVNKYDIPFVC